jgi:hypothetical protein
MLSFETVKEAYTAMQRVAPAERGPFTTIFVVTAIAYMIYYLVAGFVVWSLGRRLIQASFAAYKESRRERA